MASESSPAVRDVEVTIKLPASRKSKAGTAHGDRKSIHDILVTHFGLSGPAILNPLEIVAEQRKCASSGGFRRSGLARHYPRHRCTVCWSGSSDARSRKRWSPPGESNSRKSLLRRCNRGSFPNLFLTGEVLDLMGPSGGYNLLLAFSTGRLAARAAAKTLIL